MIAIHQPNFLPWVGYFYKIAKSDIFVLLEDAEYTKNSYINRNNIKTPNGAQWLTVPVKYSGHSLIADIYISEPEKSFKKIKNTLICNYKKAKYFDEVFNLLEFEADKVCDLNETLIRNICKYLGIGTEIIKSSGLKVGGRSTDRLVNICKALSSQKYLAGFGSKKYQDSDKFNIEGIECSVYDFIPPEYNQLWGAFIPKLSIVDLLFNCGKESINHLTFHV